MARVRRFEVKREMQDGGKLRPDDNYKHNGGNSSLEQQQEAEREANQVGGFDGFERDYNSVIEEEFDAHKYFVEKVGEIDFTDMEENQFMEEYANTIISTFSNISHDEAAALLLYVTRNEANRQGILENIRVRIDDKTKVGATRFVGIGEKGPISEIVFSEKELIDGVNNGNMEAYVTGIGHLVESACHEVEHAKQNSQIYSKNPQLNYETLRMAKESINVRVNPEFYRKNYRSYTMEKNAFLNGRLQSKKALENLRGVFTKELYSKIEKKIDELIAFDKSADTTIMKTEESEYVNSDNADMVLSELTDSIMSMYATDALDKYPILSYQYREDGTKKELLELFQERDVKIQQLQGEFSTANPSRKIEIEKEIEGITAFYDEMVQGDRQLVAQKEEMYKQQNEENNNDEISQEDNEAEIPTITNSDVEQELKEYYTDDTPISHIKAYLSEKLSLIYGDRLKNAGVDKNLMSYIDFFLEEQHLEYFDGVDTYKEMIEEFEAMIACLELVQKETEANGLEGHTHEEETPINLETEETTKREGEYTQEPFDQVLINGGFDSNCVQGIKSTIKNVNPRKLVTMDSVLSKTKEQTLIRGGIEDGNEQSAR